MAEEDTQQQPEQQQEDLEETGLGATPVVRDGPQQATNTHALPFPVVGIGASAGGVEACIELFKNLPATTGMAFVVIPHLPADQRSHLPEIIARHTKMEAVAIQSGTRPEPNRIYFLPPNAQVALQGGLLQLTLRTGDGPFRPIDSFFQSLASEQKTFAVGVVLSGMDGDGAIGLKTIKGEGGIAIVQSPESARFPDILAVAFLRIMWTVFCHRSRLQTTLPASRGATKTPSCTNWKRARRR